VERLKILPAKRPKINLYESAYRRVTIKTLKDELNGYYSLAVDEDGYSNDITMLVTATPMQGSKAVTKDGYGNVVISLFNIPEYIPVKRNCLVDIDYKGYNADYNAYLYCLQFRPPVREGTRAWKRMR
jgi:hypothetical protein